MPAAHSSYLQADGPAVFASSHMSSASSSSCTPRHIKGKSGSKFSRPRWSSPPRVLLVDDDVVYRMLSGRLLKVFGCIIDTANDGLVAVDALKMNVGKYDLVFMDIMMPRLDGISATSLIRQFDAMTPIISVTSNSLPSEILTYYSSGMNDVLPKPFTKDGLYNILEKHLVHLKNIHEMSASSSPHASSPSLPRHVLTPPPSPRRAPHLEEGSGKENSEVDAFPRPISPLYPRLTLAPMSSGQPGPSKLPPSSPLSPTFEDDAKHIPAISPSTAYTSSTSSDPHDPPYLDSPQSPQTPQSQSSTLVDLLPDDDSQFASSIDFLTGSARQCTTPTSPDFTLRIPRAFGLKRSLDREDDDLSHTDERERKRGKVD